MKISVRSSSSDQTLDNDMKEMKDNFAGTDGSHENSLVNDVTSTYRFNSYWKKSCGD